MFWLQSYLWKAYLQEEERKKFQASQASGKNVEILCKGCRKLLCYGSDIIRKGSHYISVSEDFEDKVEVLEDEEVEEYRDDMRIGE